MARSNAATPEEYLAELPPERREVIARVRDVILRNLPAGYQETMNWGMLSYEVPLARYPETYNGQPLGYAGLAAQKNHYALYLNAIYQDEGQAELRQAFEKAGRKLDMGKSCVRFRKLEDLPLDVIAQVIARTDPDEYIAAFEAARGKAGGKT
jgi:hypothetical protein